MAKQARSYDSLYQELLAVGAQPNSPIASGVNALRGIKDLKRFKVSPNVLIASVKIPRIESPAAKQVIYDSFPLERVATPIWLEFRQDSHVDQLGLLVERHQDGSLVISVFSEVKGGHGADPALWSVRRNSSGQIVMTTQPSLEAAARLSAVNSFPSIISLLVIISAPLLTDRVDEKVVKGVPQFARIRMAEPWTDADDWGVPRLGKATRPTFVADDILESLALMDGLAWSGRTFFMEQAHRDATFGLTDEYTRGIHEAALPSGPPCRH